MRSKHVGSILYIYIKDTLRRLYAFVGSSSYRISLLCMVVDYLVWDTVGNPRLLKLLLTTGSRRCFLNIYICIVSYV